MDDDELMTIGRFAKLSGLPIGTLRHYDEVGLLSPAEVDAISGYRRYRRSQLRRTWLIRVLRWIDLPIEEIRQIIDDEASRPDVLVRHRRRLERKQSLLTAQIGDATRFIEKGFTVPEPQGGCRPVQIKIAVNDVYLSTVGGMRLTDPSSDLAVAVALASAYANLPMPATAVMIGEVGLAGDLRRVSGMERRLAEAARQGFTTALIPSGAVTVPPGLNA